MSTKKEPDWKKIRNEYETIGTSYRKLAEKYGVSFKTLQPRATREGWVKGKEETQVKIRSKTGQKVVEKIAEQNSIEIAVELEAANLINELVLQSLKDKKQYKRHLIQMKEKSGDMHCGIDERQWVEEREFEVIDTKRLQSAAASLKISTELKRLLIGIIDADKKAKLDLENKRLILLQNKSGQQETVMENDKYMESLRLEEDLWDKQTERVWADDSEG